MKTRIIHFLGITLIGAMLATPALAHHDEGQGEAHPHHGPDGKHDMAAIGKALANPVSDVWALFTEFDFGWNNGDLSSGQRFSSSMAFQPVMPIKLTENSKLITRPTIPVLFSQPVPGPDGLGGIDFDRKHGLGDIVLPLLYSPNEPIKLFGGDIAFGVGPTFGFPTATDTAFKSDQFQAGPAGVLVWKTEKIIALFFPQYWWGFAKTDSDARPTSHGNLLYGVFYNLPNAWQIGTNPTITYDHKASGGNKWNVPIGITVAKTTKVGKLPVKFQLGVEYSVVHQDDFGKRFMLKFNIIPVIAPLIKKPLF
jgi:hypothetical protein